VNSALLAALLLLAGVSLQAQPESESAEVAAIRTLLGTTQPGMVVGSIVLSPVAGLYEVSIQNGQSIYVSSDARYLIPGDMYESSPEGLVNLGESRRNTLRRERIAALDEADMIIFPAEGESKAVLTVFTDVDCPYCRQLHGEIEALNSYGISVRYLAFPRTGLDTETHYKMVSTWCAPDRKAMFTAAKRGAEVPQADCNNPVAEQFELGRELGVTGTPALVFEDGTMLPGYIPAETLVEYLLSEE
jgi:thiol:disulfide interchange protein DsbC